MTGQVTPFFAITLEGQQLIHIRHIDLFLYIVPAHFKKNV